MSTAKAVLLRILLMGLVPGCLLGCAFMFGQTLLPAAFTADPTVIASVTHVIPVLAVCMVREPPLLLPILPLVSIIFSRSLRSLIIDMASCVPD